LLPHGMRPTGLALGAEQMLAFLLPPSRDPDALQPDDDQLLPSSLRPYAAGLRPAARPAGVDWQQEIVFERLGKTDQQITAVARHYFQVAQNYDAALSRE